MIESYLESIRNANYHEDVRKGEILATRLEIFFYVHFTNTATRPGDSIFASTTVLRQRQPVLARLARSIQKVISTISALASELSWVLSLAATSSAPLWELSLEPSLAPLWALSLVPSLVPLWVLS